MGLFAKKLRPNTQLPRFCLDGHIRYGFDAANPAHGFLFLVGNMTFQTITLIYFLEIKILTIEKRVFTLI